MQKQLTQCSNKNHNSKINSQKKYSNKKKESDEDKQRRRNPPRAVFPQDFLLTLKPHTECRPTTALSNISVNHQLTIG